MLHAGQTNRRKRHGHRHILADHLRRGAAPGHIQRHALLEVDLVKVRGVLAEGLFGPTATFAVIVEHLGHAAFVDAL